MKRIDSGISESGLRPVGSNLDFPGIGFTSLKLRLLEQIVKDKNRSKTHTRELATYLIKLARLGGLERLLAPNRPPNQLPSCNSTCGVTCG